MTAFNWEKQTVLVTGGAGFFGAWLCKALLDKGASVTVFSRKASVTPIMDLLGISRQLRFAQGDITSIDSVTACFRQLQPGVVFHLAAQSLVNKARENPLDTFEINIRGTWNLLEAARQSDGLQALVVASSDKVYGAQETLPYLEDSALNGIYPYDVSKLCADVIARSYGQTWQLPVSVARCGNLYGGGDLNWDRIIPATTRSLLQNQAPELRSNGRFKRDYLYIEDAVDGYLTLAAACQQPDVRGQAFNFGVGQPVEVLELVNRLCRIHGTRIEPVINDTASGEIRDQYLDCSRAEHVLGWKPAFGLEDGLRKTYQWYKQYLQETHENPM